MLGRHALAEKASFIWRKVFPCTAYSSYLERANFSYISVTKRGETSTRRNKKLAAAWRASRLPGSLFLMVSYSRSPFLSGQLFFILTVWLALSGHSWSQSSSVRDGQSQKRKHCGRECLSGQLDRSILIVGFICPPTIHFKFITKGDNFDIITKCDSSFYYKVR